MPKYFSYRIPEFTEQLEVRLIDENYICIKGSRASLKLLADVIRRFAARDVNDYENIPPGEPLHLHLYPGKPGNPNHIPLTADSCEVEICQSEVKRTGDAG